MRTPVHRQLKSTNSSTRASVASRAPLVHAVQMSDPQAWESLRHRTAIGRRDLSMPARLALQDGLIDQARTYFDYGSGRGQDVRRLQSLGYSAVGWDPH